MEIGYSIPKEGALIWFDQMAIPADAKHVPEALEFMNYMMRPEVAAKASNYVFYANGNKASQKFIDKGNPRRPGNLSVRRGDEEAVRADAI